MMYDAYQGMADVGDRVRLLAQNAHGILSAWSEHPTASPWARMSAYYELVALAGFTHARPAYAIDSLEIDGAPFRSKSAGSTGRRSASCFASGKQAARTIPRSS